MESTMKKYAERIARNEVDPHVRDDGQANGLILDPRREEVPLEMLGFGIFRLGPDAITRETGDREMVIVAQEGDFKAGVNGRLFAGGRPGGPFAPGLGSSNASALYVPRNSKLSIRGQGEVAFFEAPALGDKPPCYVPRDQVSVVSRGDWIWRRDVVTLMSPNDATTNLVVGETYNPPGFWSGTPLHRHDREQTALGESDHEEIYYHRFQWKKDPRDQFGPYGVQLLMDGESLMKAYLIGDRSAFAIPGGCHPVVASPVSALLYLWALAGSGGGLAMKDIPEFAHIKTFERVFQELEGDRTPSRILSRKQFQSLCNSYTLTEGQSALLEALLREKKYELE